MGEGIYGPPNVYNAGLDFDYSVWTPGTKLDLVNVAWNNDYRDVVKFDSKALLNAHIDSLKPTGRTLEHLSYVKPGQDVYLPIPYNAVNKYNYLRASNPTQPIPDDEQKDYYYFILECEYIAPNNTRLRLQLDVWQTYVYDVTFGNCYIERGHIGIANENNFSRYGRDYLTIPEGIDLGGEYRVIDTRNEWVMTPTIADLGFPDRYPNYDVLVFSTVDLLANPGTVDDPTLVSASGTTFQMTTQGASVYVFDPQQFHNFMATMKDKPWVTQGIISVTMIPKITRYHPEFVYSELPSFGAEADLAFPRTRTYDMHPNWRDSSEIVDFIPERYRHLNKLKTYPYMVIEMTTFMATPVVIKPEMWNSANARMFERCALLPPGQRIEFSPRYYNSEIGGETSIEDLYPGYSPQYDGVKGDDYGDYVDMVTQIANFPTMSVVNNGQLGYLAANTHGIAFQRQSADWTQQRALGMASGQYDIATGAMQAAMSQSGIGVNAMNEIMANNNRNLMAQAIVGAVTGVPGGAIGGAAFGGGVGAAAGAVGGAMGGVGGLINAGYQQSTNEQNNAVLNTQAAQTVQTQNKQAGLMRDTNKDLADWAARGDYGNQISGINAKVQDAALIQPTTSGQIGGESMNMINGGWQLSLRWKLIDRSAIRVVGEIWLRYGYAIRAFVKVPQSLKVMTKFTYWKMTETYISSALVPEGFKQSIRGILEKGVTVWTDPNDIGNIDIADNDPLPGVSY